MRSTWPALKPLNRCRRADLSAKVAKRTRFAKSTELVVESRTCGAKRVALRTPRYLLSTVPACSQSVLSPRLRSFPLHAVRVPSLLGTISVGSRAESSRETQREIGRRVGVTLGRMAMALAGERIAMASSLGYCAHVSSPAKGVSSSLSLAGLSHRRTRSFGMVVAETGRLVGGWGGGAGVSSLVCRSSMRPLSDANGNVAEFESEEQFESIVNEAGDKLVVVDISTTTCGPCKMIFPKYVEMSLDYPDAVFLKINGNTSSESRALMRKWGVRAVPNFRFFKNGQQVHSHTGAKLDELKARFAEHYGQPIKV